MQFFSVVVILSLFLLIKSEKEQPHHNEINQFSPSPFLFSPVAGTMAVTMTSSSSSSSSSNPALSSLGPTLSSTFSERPDRTDLKL
jgi:hypothetical protein